MNETTEYSEYKLPFSDTFQPFIDTYQPFIDTFQPFIDTKSVKYAVNKTQDRKRRIALSNADIYYLQSWFKRISCKRKQRFIMNLLRTIDDIPSLKLFMSALKPLTKDLFYSESQCAKYSFDVLPNDDDRSLNIDILEEIIDKDFKWLISLNQSQKCHIILDLIKMSGSALAKKALNEANVLYDIYEFIEYLENKFLSVDTVGNYKIGKHTIKKTGLLKIITAEIANNGKVLPLMDLYKKCSSLKPDILTYRNMNELLRKVQSNEKLWEITLKKILRTVSTGEVEGKNGKPRLTTSAIETDKFQLLPLWINRQILKYLDNDTKTSLSQMDFFWSEAIVEETKEEEVRIQLDRVIQKLDIKLLNTKLPGKPVLGPANKQRRPLSAGSIKYSIKKSIKRPGSASLETFQDDNKESIFTVLKFKPMSRNPFIGPHKDSIISTVYMYDRSIACSRKWVACTENTSVVFYNLITGAKAPFKIHGHSLAVTCVAFFPFSMRIVTGSLDRTIKTWNIWNGKELANYTGHTDVIISVAANESYLVSCSLDETIRVFSQLSGFTIIKIQHSGWTPSILALTHDNLVYWANVQGSLKLFSITDKTVDKTILTAHQYSVFFLAKFDELILTTGGDLYVRVWNANLLKEKPLLEFYHEITVCSAVYSHLTVITACADGCLRFWNISNGKLFRTITVNMPRIPIISMSVQHYYNHIKIICNNEGDLYILEFSLKPGKLSRKVNPYQGIMMHQTLKKRNAEDRLIKLHKRKCTLPLIRFRENYKTSYDCLLRNCLRGKQLNQVFPRYKESIKSSGSEK